MKAVNFSQLETLMNRKNVLGVVWGISVMVYEFGDRPSANNPLTWTLAVLAFASATMLILRPAKNLFWVLTAAALTAQVLSLLPMVNNHSTLFAAFGVTVMATMAVSKWGRNKSTDGWFETNEPFFRIVFLLGYGSAAIAKLNSGFFDATISCANSMAKEVYNWLPFVLPIFDSALIPYLVAATELFVFVGLIFRATRPWAIIVATLFHFALSLNFTSAGLAFNPSLYALLVLFIPVAATDNLVIFWRELQVRFRFKAINQLIGFVGFVTLSFVFFFIVPLSGMQYYARFVITMIFSLIMIGVLIYSALKFRTVTFGVKFATLPSVMTWAILGVLVLNSASPYLGGKTGSTFTMYSNLQVERGKSNHFFIPRLPIKTLQDDLVEIKYSSNAKLKRLKSENKLVNWLVMQQFAKTMPNDSVSYVRGGKTYQVAVIREDPELNNMDPIMGKLFWYRYVPLDGGCQW